MANNTKVVVVTGVSSGIGRATAEMFIERGCEVFGTVRNLEKANPIDGVKFVEMDVRDERSIQQAIKAIIAQTERIDVLINSAGTTLLGATEESSVAEGQSLFDTNVWGVLRTIQAVLPFMRQQRSGRIVNISSVLGFLPAPYMALYSASKHAVEGLSETLDHEIRDFGIRVSLVEPSFTKTNLDINAPLAANLIPIYDATRETVTNSIVQNVQKAPSPEWVASTVINAALGPWRMRHTPKGEASLLRKFRRFMPFNPVDKGIRKTFGIK